MICSAERKDVEKKKHKHTHGRVPSPTRGENDVQRRNDGSRFDCGGAISAAARDRWFAICEGDYGWTVGRFSRMVRELEDLKSGDSSSGDSGQVSDSVRFYMASRFRMKGVRNLRFERFEDFGFEIRVWIRAEGAWMGL
ncbi:hypothetical protein OROGR_033160 [Orobanche gracilis]